LEGKDIDAAKKILCDSFNGSLFTEDEIRKFRAFTNVWERKAKILEAAQKRTNRRMTLEEIGEPICVLTCCTSEEWSSSWEALEKMIRNKLGIGIFVIHEKKEDEEKKKMKKLL